MRRVSVRADSGIGLTSPVVASSSKETVRPVYIPAFYVPKQKYASYVSIKRQDSRGWHIYLCEREECAHAQVHVCTLPIYSTLPQRPPCARCYKKENLTWHHVYPQRFFKRNTKIGSYKISLCRSCHDAIEKIIPIHHPLRDSDYLSLVVQFLG